MLEVLHINCNYSGHNPVHRVMMQELNKQNIKNFVYCPVSSGNDNSDNNVLISKCFNSHDRLFFHYKSRKIKNDLLKKVDVEKFNIIHAYTLFTDGNVAFSMHKKYGIPYVVAIRNTDLNVFFKRMPHLRKRGIDIVKNANAVFFLSKSYMNKLINKYVPKTIRDSIIEKSYVIPNGVDEFWLNNIHQNDVNEKLPKLMNKQLTLVHAGEINKNKNIINTCKTIELMQKDGWSIKYFIAGKIKDQNVYDTCKKYIDYKGMLNKEELLALYRESDIFVMPSFTETFGLSYVEAISQGLPVIYSKYEGFDEQFQEGEVGYHVNPHDSKEIKEAIEKVVENYKKISNGISNKSLKYSWKELSDKYYELYNKILTTSRR